MHHLPGSAQGRPAATFIALALEPSQECPPGPRPSRSGSPGGEEQRTDCGEQGSQAWCSSCQEWSLQAVWGSVALRRPPPRPESTDLLVFRHRGNPAERLHQEVCMAWPSCLTRPARPMAGQPRGGDCVALAGGVVSEHRSMRGCDSSHLSGRSYDTKELGRLETREPHQSQCLSCSHLATLPLVPVLIACRGGPGRGRRHAQDRGAGTGEQESNSRDNRCARMGAAGPFALRAVTTPPSQMRRPRLREASHLPRLRAHSWSERHEAVFSTVPTQPHVGLCEECRPQAPDLPDPTCRDPEASPAQGA